MNVAVEILQQKLLNVPCKRHFIVYLCKKNDKITSFTKLRCLFIDKQDNYSHALGLCYSCHTPEI